MRKLQSVQALRGIAACSVVAFHSAVQSGDAGWLGFGAAGVDLFFVISGYIMATVAPGRSVGEFVGSRFRRIYPIYAVAALPWIFATILAGGDLTARRILVDTTLWPLWGSFQRPTLGVGWTLCFEVTFYAAVAIVLWTGRWRTAIAAYLLCMVAALATGLRFFDMVGSPLFLDFLAGALIAHLPKLPRYGEALALVGFAALVLVPGSVTTGAPMSIFQPWLSLIRAVLWGIPAAMVVYGSLCCETRFASPLWKPALVLGEASYSIYLFHVIAVKLLPVGISFFAGVGLGVFVWWQLERRLLEWFMPQTEGQFDYVATRLAQ